MISLGLSKKPKAKSVVVVDDDEMIRALIQEVLQSEGFEVLALDCGAALKERFSSRDAPPEVLLLDLSLPDAFGEKLLDTARRKWPQTRCIVCTGHISDQLDAHFAGRASAILRKPFELDELIELF